MRQISLAVLGQVLLREALKQLGQRDPLLFSQRSKCGSVGFPFLECDDSFTFLRLVRHLGVKLFEWPVFESQSGNPNSLRKNTQINGEFKHRFRFFDVFFKQYTNFEEFSTCLVLR